MTTFLNKVEQFANLAKSRNLFLAKKIVPYKPQKTELEEMIKDEDFEKFNSILIKNPDIVTMRDEIENTLLMEAAYHNKPSIVKCLIDAGSDVYAVDRDKCNAYHYSAIYGHHNVLKVLINHDVTNINNVDCDNDTPLHVASTEGQIECVKLLLSIPAIDVNIRNNDNKTGYGVADNVLIKRLFKKHKNCFYRAIKSCSGIANIFIIFFFSKLSSVLWQVRFAISILLFWPVIPNGVRVAMAHVMLM
ncbi:poly [ADP-ribose] polymerase tankyrase-like [Hydractinia symbiolongicarpus]|uniref:poly [ADP-ribose] polymerase tankyrase-like n=1 Tax=Hydractinia symbiolongicarpus TaxID=13093 RepID=UPI00254C7664|nr:poly [ADP-ribose] polymerase tankyrase-like [Hydractinia symbiolongicarpus]